MLPGRDTGMTVF